MYANRVVGEPIRRSHQPSGSGIRSVSPGIRAKRSARHSALARSMRSFLGDDGGIFDGGDDLQEAATLGAVFQVDLEHPLQQPRPAHAHRRRGRGRLGAVG
jgi:hypothetical protein